MDIFTPGGPLLIFLAAMFTSNILLSKFLGMCSFIAISRNMKTAFGMGVAVTFVTFCTAMLNYAVYKGFLVKGSKFFGDADLTHLNFLIFILVIAGFVQLLEIIMERFTPALYFSLGIFLPLITVNCAILGVSLFMIDPTLNFNFVKTSVYALGSGMGYCLAICLMAGIRNKLKEADIPEPLQGLGSTVIVTGLMALAFVGVTGMVELG